MALKKSKLSNLKRERNNLNVGLNPAREAAALSARGTDKKVPSRAGKRAVTIFMDDDAHAQLRILAFQLRKTVQQLGDEAFSLIVDKYR
jgi:hypothetical protein